MDDAAFQQRFDLARMVLERKYRWAKLTLRNLQPVARDKGTLSVDRYMRLYHGPEADTWSDKEFVGALWHEVNHLLRHHPDRLEHLPKKHHMAPAWANVAADLEINDDLKAQGLTMPEGCLYSETYNHEEGHAAEDHFLQFVEEQEEKERDKGKGEEGDGEGEVDEEPQDADDSAAPEGDSNQAPPQSGTAPAPDNAPNCGSGSNGEERPDELPEPDQDELGDLARNQRKQDEEVLEAAKEGGENGEALPPGLTGDMVKAAIERLGKSEHDWRATMATEVRNAIEQRSDEAEEYTFRRRSRRSAAFDGIILPGSFRPIPNLAVVVDISGSMDQEKLTASMRELHGILERLAIPQFTAYPCNQFVQAVITVSNQSDIDRVMEHRGGGTNLQLGVNQAMEEGHEVIVVLTDNETRWNENIAQGIPVIIGGINRRPNSLVPSWARVVDVESERSQFDD